MDNEGLDYPSQQTVWEDFQYAPGPALRPKYDYELRGQVQPEDPAKGQTLIPSISDAFPAGSNIVPQGRFSGVRQDQLPGYKGEPPKPIKPSLIKDVIGTDWISSWAAFEMERSKVIDPNWKLDEKRFVEDAKTVPEDYHEMMLRSRSELEYNQVLARAREVNDMEQRINSWGWTGASARLLLSFADPTALGVALASEGATAPFLYAAKATRLGRFIRAGLVGGVSNAAAAAASSAVNPTVDFKDVGTAFAIGLVMAGTFGALRGTEEGARLAQVGTDIAKGNDAILPPELQVDTSKSVGASLNPAYDPGLPNLIADERVHQIDAVRDRDYLDKLDFSMSGRTKASYSPTTATYGPQMVDDGLGARNANDISRTSVSVATDQRLQRTYNQWFQIAVPEFKKWAYDKGNRLGALGRIRKKGQFMYEVQKFVEDKAADAEANYHPSVVKAGQRYRWMLMKTLEDAKRLGLPDFEDIHPDKFYAPKYMDRDRIAEFVNRVDGGWEGLTKVAYNAFREIAKTLEPEIIERAATAYMKRLARATYGFEDGFAQIQRIEKRDVLLEKLKEIMPGLGESDYDQLARGLIPEEKATGVEGRTKRRSNVDYNVKTPIKMKDGTFKDTSLNDFFVQDAEFTLLKYMRQIQGRLAYAEHPFYDANGKLLHTGIRSRQEFERTVLDNVRNDHAKLGTSADAREADIARLDFMWKAINGEQVQTGNAKYRKWIRRALVMQFARLMNNMGVNQIQEITGVYNQFGIKAMLQGIPAFGRMIDDMGNSVHRDKIVRDITAWTGGAGDTLFSRTGWRYDHDRLGEAASGKAGRWFDQALEVGREVTTHISAMRYINAGLQELAIKSAVYKFDDLAKKGLKSLQRHGKLDEFFRGKQLQRLRSIGLSDKDLTDIFDQFNTKVIRDGKKIDTLNFKDWDPNVRDKFTAAVHRATNKAIQQNDIGNLAMWMNSSTSAQVLLQFKKFILGAWQKQTLYGVRHFDLHQMMTWMLSLMAGSVTYLELNYPAYLVAGDEQKVHMLGDGKAGTGDTAFERFRNNAKDRFSMQSVLLGGFGRTGFSSIIPTLVDFGMVEGLQEDPIFSFSRASGSAMDPKGTPIYSNFDAARKWGTGLYESFANDREMTQPEIMGMWNALPFMNWQPIATALRYMTRDKPLKKEQK